LITSASYNKKARKGIYRLLGESDSSRNAKPAEQNTLRPLLGSANVDMQAAESNDIESVALADGASSATARRVCKFTDILSAEAAAAIVLVDLSPEDVLSLGQANKASFACCDSNMYWKKRLEADLKHIDHASVRCIGYYKRLYVNLREELIETDNLVCGGH